LLTTVADVNIRDHIGKTPLFYAVAHGRPECVRVLLAAGVTVNYRDEYGRTPLDLENAHHFGDVGEEDRFKTIELIMAAGGLSGADLYDDDDDEDA
jgi:ankyrin repeat protein